MLSKEGFVYHIGQIEHETNMYNVYKSPQSKKNIEKSKEALIRHFEEQERAIRNEQTDGMKVLEELKESTKKSINSRLATLDEEERSLARTYQSRMRVANDGYYVGSARSKARREADEAQAKIDIVLKKKIELLKEIESLN